LQGSSLQDLLSVLSRRAFHQAFEETEESGVIFEAALYGHLIRGQVRVFEQRLGPFDVQVLDLPARRAAKYLLKSNLEVAPGYRHFLQHIPNGKGPVGIVHDEPHRPRQFRFADESEP